VRNSAYTIHLI